MNSELKHGYPLYSLTLPQHPNLCQNSMKQLKIILLIFVFSCQYTLIAQEYVPIFSNSVSVSDTFFRSSIVKDEFRWLEDTKSPETQSWVENQNRVSKKYLAKAGFNTNAFNQIDQYAYTRYDHPRKKGNYYFTYAYYNNVGSPALFCQNNLNDNPDLLVDPNFISMKDQIQLGNFEVSKDSKLLAYQYSRNGSDWQELNVISLKTRLHKSDHLTGLKYSAIAWQGDGFFYSTYSQENQFAETRNQKVMYHKLGTEQSEDQLIFERKNNPSATFGFITTSDERFFVLTETNNKAKIVNIYYIDYESETPVIKCLISNLHDNVNILDHHNGKFIATTSKESNNGMIVEIDPANPYKWKAIVSEYNDGLLLEVIPFKDRIVTMYQANQHPILMVYDYFGTALYSLEFPMVSSISGFSGESTDEEMLFDFESYTIPPVVFSFNIRTFERKLTKKTVVSFDFESIVYEEVEYMSSDSTMVPMVLIYQKGLEKNGKNPAVLEAYGGFGVVTSPAFDPGIIYFVKNGGVYAYANIRGGGDKGIEWVHQGRGLNKQNSINDFIAAAEYLVLKSYTSSNLLASMGSSHGGLIVAAAAIQSPGLFKAVIPIVAPLDLIRKENFTVGRMNSYEYGSVTDSLGFLNLLSYSPYHNIDEKTNYPAMLVITSENDDRVPPFHSYKFVAAMQSRDSQKNPIILKTELQSGHSGAASFRSHLSSIADIFGFILNEIKKQ